MERSTARTISSWGRRYRSSSAALARRDSRALERFRAEVRNARQISHPNVCRVYDIGEYRGLHFMSMEFVDGEDLATLLRRIGRLRRARRTRSRVSCAQASRPRTKRECCTATSSPRT
jgi:serine/threonine protein kinase